MTRKDYIAIADALAQTRPDSTMLDPIVVKESVEIWDQWLRDRRRVADVLASDNPRFDRQRFYDACEGSKA